jgi:hypothetical protein
MALVERLMGLEAPKIPVHDFFAAAGEIIDGQLTATQVKTALGLDAAASTEFDLLAATAPTGTSATALANKALWLERMHRVFILAEGDYQGYHTAQAVRTRLGI